LCYNKIQDKKLFLSQKFIGVYMKTFKILSLSLTAIAVLGFSGCGSSGGGSSTTPTIAFPSDAVDAEPTIENAEEVKDVVAQNQNSAYSINAVSTSDSQNIAIGMKLISDTTMKIEKNFYALNETINETEECSEGGSINYSGSGSETGGATITYSFNNCIDSGITMNGKITTVLSNYNETYSDYTYYKTTYVTDLLLSFSNYSIKILGGSTTDITFTDIVDTYTANGMKMDISAITDTNGEKNGQENAVYYFKNQDYYSTSMYQTQGKIYINNLTSYVTYDTSYDMSQTPFVFDYNGLTSGEAHYLMANGAKVKVTVNGGEATVAVDTDGDGVYDLSE